MCDTKTQKIDHKLASKHNRTQPAHYCIPMASWYNDVVYGGVAGSVAELCGMPPLVVRTRMMVQGAGGGAASGTTQYKGFTDCFASILKQDGVRGFYKGGVVNVLCTPAARGVYMGAHGLSQKYVGQVRLAVPPSEDSGVFAPGSAHERFFCLWPAVVPTGDWLERFCVWDSCAARGFSRIRSAVGEQHRGYCLRVPPCHSPQLVSFCKVHYM
eukprot:SAG11_NODE_3454_length_2438_cov_2.156905_1_plen_213_part_00